MALKACLICAACEFSIMFVLWAFCKVWIPIQASKSLFPSVTTHIQNTCIYLFNEQDKGACKIMWKRGKEVQEQFILEMSSPKTPRQLQEGTLFPRELKVH